MKRVHVTWLNAQALKGGQNQRTVLVILFILILMRQIHLCSWDSNFDHPFWHTLQTRILHQIFTGSNHGRSVRFFLSIRLKLCFSMSLFLLESAFHKPVLLLG